MGHLIVPCTFFYIFWFLQILLISASTPALAFANTPACQGVLNFHIDELYLLQLILTKLYQWDDGPGVHGAVLVCGVVPPASMGPLPGARNQGKGGALQVVVES